MPYMTRDQMIAAWDALVTSYPSVCSSEILGYSVQNRPIKLYKIGSPQGGRFAVVGDVNGEEKASVEIMYSFALWAASSPDADAVRMRERNLLLFVPLVCVDTYDVKTPNANGVDIYFNGDFDFGANGGTSICTLSQYTDQVSCLAAGGKWMNWNYRGPYALSEPETRILKQFFANWLPAIEIDCHDGSSGNYVWYVNGMDAGDTVYIQTVLQNYLARAAAMGVPTYNVSMNEYGGGRPEPCAYFHNNKQIQALIVECCTHDPEFSTIASTHYPKMHALFVTLAQETEVVPPQPVGSFHKVVGDKIIDTATGKEIMWRGAGGSYFLHASSLAACLAGWQPIIDSAKQGGLNTMRLAFKFDWDTYGATGDTFDFAKMDAVIDLLTQNGIKVILDHHGSYTNQILNPNLIPSWVEVATYYADNPNIVAYELYNEPSPDGTVTAQQNAQAYHDITLAVRAVDPNHICIWETPTHYLPDFSNIIGLMLPNVVYSKHAWWTNIWDQIKLWGAYAVSVQTFDPLVRWRKLYNIPIWLGEFGGPGGGNPDAPYPGLGTQEEYEMYQWQVCGELLWRAEEQVISWNLWCGTMSPITNKLAPYTPLLPPKNLNTNFVRQPFGPPDIPKLTDYLVSTTGSIDQLGDYEIEMWHGADSVTFKPANVIIKVREYRVVNGVSTLMEDTNITLSEQTTVGVRPGPEDWNTIIMPVSYTDGGSSSSDFLFIVLAIGVIGLTLI